MHEKSSDQNTTLDSNTNYNKSKIAYYNNWNNFFAQNYNNSYKQYYNNCIDDEIQTTTCLGNNISANTVPPACSIHQHPRINTIAPRDPFQRMQISAELKQWLLTTNRHYSHYSYCSLFATIRCSLFPIRDYSLFRFSRHVSPREKKWEPTLTGAFIFW